MSSSDTNPFHLEFEDKVLIYKLFFFDELSQEQAERLIGYENWGEVTQVASAELSIEHQDLSFLDDF